jgi:murein DD-endopeptidase MepM/ murein hydrolase activator NlpD
LRRKQLNKLICTLFTNFKRLIRKITIELKVIIFNSKNLFSLKEKFFFFRQPAPTVVFLFILGLILIIINYTNENKLLAYKESDRGILGGPKLITTNLALANNNTAIFALAANQSSNENVGFGLSSMADSNIYYLIDNNSLQNPSPILTSIKTDKNGILIYKVQKGDTLLSLASEFGVSLDTIKWANNLKNERIIPGEELIILPVSGVLHEIKPGDTIEKIAELYSVATDKIIVYNNLTNSSLIPGQKIIVPDGRMPRTYKVFAATSSLPEYPYYYIIPTTGFNWGILHNVNAVDIANRCDTPVLAAAEGLVETVSYDNSYGKHIKIQHPNNTETLYAHLNQVQVKEGDYVMQGQLIGLMGNTGYVVGSSGCHLHFEVRGAKNPFAK